MIVLATCSFIFVTAEMMPVGLLPEISAGLDVTQAQVGLLLTSYAAVAAVTTIPMTALTMRFPRHRLLAATLLVFVVAQLMAAFAPSFLVLTLARVFSAAAHGVFWAIVAPIASRLAPPQMAGKAMGLVFTGSALAMVMGAPLATVIGQASSWRIAVVSVAAVGALSLVGILLVVPVLPVLPKDAAASLGGLFASAGRQIVSKATVPGCAITVIAVLGQFTAYTYVAPLAERGGGITGSSLALLLLGFGIAGVLGNLTAGRFIDRRPDLVTMTILGLMSLSMAVLVTTPGLVITAVIVILWGYASSPLSMALQAAVIRRAPTTKDAAASVQVVAFQIGIGSGALLGERLFHNGHLVLLPVIGAVLTAVALLLVMRAKETFPSRPVAHVDAMH
nr:MFS transporter [Kineosporia babensis]